MKIDLEPVIALQELDIRIRDLKIEREKAPARLDALRARLAEEEAAIGAIEEANRELFRKKAEIDDELQLETVRLGKSQAKLMTIKNNREYQALLKEIEEIKRANKAREDEIVAMMEESEKNSAEMAGKREAMEATRKEMDAEDVHLKGVVDEMDRQTAALDQEREKIMGSIRKDILSRYEFLRVKRGGVAIVEVRQGVCSGCNMNIPPQLFNELLRNEKLHFCPTCQRIVYAKVEAAQGGK